MGLMYLLIIGGFLFAIAATVLIDYIGPARSNNKNDSRTSNYTQSERAAARTTQDVASRSARMR